ncbi:Sodium-independent sulfate anion transporter [Orchesella cincta]|uniref:Sodium-independent sulfate anion transporter n=1 Tax=Orchesella cincta TaxID=48709 RepID=A0A1D2N1H3_ORCCI|nr:Sodium-independent sulfate anion transporter [Orchesella cincta]
MNLKAVAMSSEKKSQDSRERLSTSTRIMKTLKKRLPITSWLPAYTRKDGVSDIIAGVTVGLTVVPQSMAYAAIAGLTPEYGLYSSYLGVLIYVLLGTCRQATIGPTAVMGLLTYQTCGQDYPACVILTGFYAGMFELIMAALQLGWVVSFISEPVTVGFTSGAAMTIMSSQIKSFLGESGAKGDGFLTYWKAIFSDISTVKAGDTTLGVLCLVILLLLRKLKDLNPKSKPLKTAFWLISLSRNVIIILVTSLIAYLWQEPPFKLTGKVRGGFPTISPPQFELPYRPTMINETLIDSEEHYSFWDTWSVLKTGPLVIALISILQNVAISKAFGAGQTVDATQEMLALGTASVTGGFFSAIPISASFSRSAVNDASGVRSPLGGVYTGIIVILALSFLTPSFYWIPKASLSAVIIAAVIFMIDYEAVIPMWKISKIDCIACLITFLASMLLGMEYGILIGVVVSVGALLLKSLRPEVI